MLPLYLPETPPGMVVVKGGETGYENKSIQVKSFYVSAFQETNSQYKAYLDFLKRCKLWEKYSKALPDTLWFSQRFTKEETAYLSCNYLRNPLFSDYPVMGLGAEQIREYCTWKSDRMNEMIMIREGILDYWEHDSSTVNEMFHTEVYLQGKWTGVNKTPIASLPANNKSGTRNIRMEDGILLPLLRALEPEEASLLAQTQAEIPVTPNAYSQKKSDKGRHFSHLFVSKKKFKPTEFQTKLAAKGLKPVYEGYKDIYGLWYPSSDKKTEGVRLATATNYYSNRSFPYKMKKVNSGK